MPVYSPRLLLATPRDLTENQMFAMRTFILAHNGQVSSNGLLRRIKAAEYVAAVYDGQRILTIGGLKHPDKGYARFIHTATGHALDHYLELGWLATHPDFRRKRLSVRVVYALLNAARLTPHPIFATVHADNVASLALLLNDHHPTPPFMYQLAQFQGRSGAACVLLKENIL